MNVFQRNLEDFFYTMEFQKNPPKLFVAQIIQNLQAAQKESQASGEKQCQSLEGFENFQISAESAISVEVSLVKDPVNKTNKTELNRVIFEKNPSKKMPIASLTKLMTAIVAAEFYDDSYRVEIPKEAVSQPETSGNLTVGEILNVGDLLHIMLIESSNDAAFSLGAVVGQEGFTHLMNLQAKKLGLNNTLFFNPTGIDPANTTDNPNYSTAQDLLALMEYILAEYPEILEIISKKEYDLYLQNGILHHTLKNTNELLGEIPRLIGGKTGYTERAGGCLIVILKNKEGSYLINIVLNSPNRFGEMIKLIEHGLPICPN